MNKNIPIETLRSFVKIAELGSFTQAGEQLARSQSAISLQIKRLESLIEQPIFYRKGHNFELTSSGKTLMRYATQILQLNDNALNELGNKLVVCKVRFFIPSEFAIALLPKIVANFVRENPQITLEVMCDLSRNLNNDIKLKKYDLILSLLDETHPFDEPKPNNISQRKHYSKNDRLVWVSSSRYIANDEEPIRLIVAPEGCIYRKRGIKHLNESNIPWQIVYTIMDISGMQAAIEEGLGITVLAESAVPDSLTIIPPPRGSKELGTMGIALLSADNLMTEACQILASFILEHLRQPQ
jgi:DNA-binding transcriptional LysR family regulator